MNRDYLKKIQKNTFRVIVLSYVVMCLGSFVRANDAGLSCPDWPLCYGKVIPIFDFRIFLEWFHRLLAAALGVNLLYACFLIVRDAKARKAFLGPMLAAGVLLIVQIILGGLTVLQMIDPGVVSLHLINAVFFFGVLLMLYAKGEQLLGLQTPSRPELKGIKVFSWVLLCLTVAQIFVGGMVSTNFAGTVCPDFPRCFGSWWPSASSFLVTLQMSHRYLGFLVAAAMVIFSVYTSAKPVAVHTRRAARVLPVLVILQIVLGVFNVYFALPVWSTVLHLANAILMFALCCLSTLELALGPEPSESADFCPAEGKEAIV